MLNQIKTKDDELTQSMVVGFTTANVISAYHHWSCEFESRSGDLFSIQHYVIKFFSDLWEGGGLLRAVRFLPPIKLTAICSKPGQWADMNICIRGIDCASCWNLELFRMCDIFSNFHFIISNYRMAEYNRLWLN
jgi:hypothetical protein